MILGKINLKIERVSKVNLNDKMIMKNETWTVNLKNYVKSLHYSIDRKIMKTVS